MGLTQYFLRTNKRSGGVEFLARETQIRLPAHPVDHQHEGGHEQARPDETKLARCQTNYHGCNSRQQDEQERREMWHADGYCRKPPSVGEPKGSSVPCFRLRCASRRDASVRSVYAPIGTSSGGIGTPLKKLRLRNRTRCRVPLLPSSGAAARAARRAPLLLPRSDSARLR